MQKGIITAFNYLHDEIDQMRDEIDQTTQTASGSCLLTLGIAALGGIGYALLATEMKSNHKQTTQQLDQVNRQIAEVNREIAQARIRLNRIPDPQAPRLTENDRIAQENQELREQLQRQLEVLAKTATNKK